MKTEKLFIPLHESPWESMRLAVNALVNENKWQWSFDFVGMAILHSSKSIWNNCLYMHYDR